MKERTCLWCQRQFETTVAAKKCCSSECSVQHKREYQRKWQAGKYVKRVNDLIECEFCNQQFRPKKAGTLICSDLCRWRKRCDEKSQRTQASRHCVYCGTQDGLHVIGKPVCKACRVDQRDPEISRQRELRRKYRKYGITEELYFQMLESQDHRCKICRTSEPGSKGWQIDHCHASNIVRGILCHHCNTGLGSFRDDVQIMKAAIEYLHVDTLFPVS